MLANNKPTCSPWPEANFAENDCSGAYGVTATARRVYACVYDNTEETEFGAAEGGSCAIDEWL